MGPISWETIMISVVGGAIVAWIAAYKGAEAGGETAKIAAIMGAEKAAEIEEENRKIKRAASEKKCAQIILEEMKYTKDQLAEIKIEMAEFKHSFIPARTLVYKRVYASEYLLEQIRIENLFDLDIWKSLRFYYFELEKTIEHYDLLEGSCVQYQNLLLNYYKVVDPESKAVFKKAYDSQETIVNNQIAAVQKQLSVMLDLIEETELRSLLEKYKKD